MLRLLPVLTSWLIALPIALSLAIAAPARADEKPGKPPGSEICRKAIDAAEDAYGLPFGILQAISMAESGRWDAGSRAVFAWPWTVTAHGTGKFYPTRKAAIAAVRRLKAAGTRNIDVGCMQINLYYHPHAFDSLEEAFDPRANSRYAARLFAELRKQSRSISRAVAHYHSSTRSRFLPYKHKVMDFWSQERLRHYAELRRQKIAEWRARQAALQAKRNAAMRADQRADAGASAPDG